MTLTLGALRKALANLPDDMPVVVEDERWECYSKAVSATVQEIPWDEREDCGPIYGPKDRYPKLICLFISLDPA